MILQVLGDFVDITGLSHDGKYLTVKVEALLLDMSELRG